MPAQCGLELGGAVPVVVVHLCQVLDELRLRLRVSSEPVLVDLAVGVVIVPIDVVFVDQSVTVVVLVIHGAVVDVVVRPG